MGDKRGTDSIPEENPAKRAKGDDESRARVDDTGKPNEAGDAGGIDAGQEEADSVGRWWENIELPDDDDTEEAYAMVAEMDREIQAQIPRILGPEDVQKELGSTVKTQMEVLNLPKATVLQLLDHCSWNPGLLQEKYYSDNRDSELGSFLPTSDEASSSSATTEEIECPICYHPFTPRVTGPPPPRCGHHFCKKCSFTHLKNLVNETFGNCTFKCPAYGCKVPLSDDHIRHVFRSHPLILSKYERLQRNCFVEKNKNYKFCPGTDCAMTWKLDSTVSTFSEAKCHCGENFCFGCALPWHYPLKCDLSKLWSKKMGDDSENATWLNAYTKPCPKCQSSIEKNGGCNHMTCRKCAHQFCWICLGDWKQHRDFYNCSRGSTANTSSVSAAVGRLQRFTFASDRFISHAQSYRFEKKLMAEANQKMIDVHRECNLPNSTDVSFYKDAVRTLLACRQLLQYSFAFAHCLEPALDVSIFENNMVNLHEAIEKLSGFLEGKRSPRDIWTNKQTILDLANFCDARRQILINFVNDGYQKEVWKFRKDL